MDRLADKGLLDLLEEPTDKCKKKRPYKKT